MLEIVIGPDISYLGSDIKMWVRDNPDNEVVRQLKEIYSFNGRHSIKDSVYYYVDRENGSSPHRGYAIYRDWVKSPKEYLASTEDSNLKNIINGPSVLGLKIKQFVKSNPEDCVVKILKEDYNFTGSKSIKDDVFYFIKSISPDGLPIKYKILRDYNKSPKRITNILSKVNSEQSVLGGNIKSYVLVESSSKFSIDFVTHNVLYGDMESIKNSVYYFIKQNEFSNFTLLRDNKKSPII